MNNILLEDWAKIHKQAIDRQKKKLQQFYKDCYECQQHSGWT